MKSPLKFTSAFIILFICSSQLIAQEASVAPAAAQPAAKHSCRDMMMNYCADMKKPIRKGFHHSIEWGGIYLGPTNDVTVRMAGHTYSGDMHERNALRMNAGYQFNPYLYIGGGMGAEYQHLEFTNKAILPTSPPEPEYVNQNYTGSLWIVPFYAEIKGYLLNKPITPFLQLRVGYAPSIYVGEGQHAAYSSSYNNIAVGVKIFNHLSITAGYLFMYQPTSISGYYTPSNNRILDTSNPYQHRLTVGVSIGM